MTKCIVLGEEPKEKKLLKPIEFKFVLDSNMNKIHTEANPCLFLNVERVVKKYMHSDFDVMFAYDKNRDNGYFYLGHWNDGVAG
jgi:hypothetical protein